MSAPKTIRKATGRSVKTWAGATPDSKVPNHVRLRILRRFNSKCSLTGIIIADGQAFDLDHIVRLEDGGTHSEDNLQPVLRLPHEVKSAAERKLAAKADRIAKRAHGLDAPPKRKIESRGFEPSGKRPKIDKSCLPTLPPRALYR